MNVEDESALDIGAESPQSDAPPPGAPMTRRRFVRTCGKAVGAVVAIEIISVLPLVSGCVDVYTCGAVQSGEASPTSSRGTRPVNAPSTASTTSSGGQIANVECAITCTQQNTTTCTVECDYMCVAATQIGCEGCIDCTESCIQQCTASCMKGCTVSCTASCTRSCTKSCTQSCTKSCTKACTANTSSDCCSHGCTDTGMQYMPCNADIEGHRCGVICTYCTYCTVLEEDNNNYCWGL